ncbi:unnamed protein product [Pelagomonas calceolata]|uniref:Histone deacetylase domain-containing protein n=3 Tax=Pelagomonas calceolata TaxID=35677 RepID=A0A8J2WTI6_9STRA|nr:unnamed protein product [Pelagomonas calceolata]
MERHASKRSTDGQGTNVQPPPPKRQRRESSPVIYCHDDCARHVTTGDGDAEHQESPARLAAIAAALQTYARRRDFAPASREALLRVHSARYLDAVSSIETRGRLSPMLRTRVLGESGVDAAAGATPVGPGTWTAATRAAGAALAAVRDATPGSRAFVLVRPPGHHAMREGYDVSAGGCGFCVLGNAAVAAAEALTSEKTRVAIVDFDVHHGNGTEDFAMRAGSERLLYASAHLREVYEDSSLDFFPGTGAAGYMGPGRNPSVCNVSVTPAWIEPGARERFVSAVDKISRKLAAFRPSLLVISAGFDALEGDAGQLNPWTPDDPDLPPHVSPEVLDGVGLRPEDYGTMTRALLGAIHEDASVVSILEGGYGVPDGAGGFERSGLVAAAVAHVEALDSRSHSSS